MPRVDIVEGPAPGDLRQAAWWFLFDGGKLLLREDGAPAVPRFRVDRSSVPLATGEPVFLGMLGSEPCLAAELDEPHLSAASFALRPLRACLEHLAPEQAALACRAASLLHWRRRNHYCGGCGAPTCDHEGGPSLACSACGQVTFPRSSPAVIVAVVRDDEILLARSPRFAPGMYSVLAGFVEPGETLEACLRREVREEVGIEVCDIRYFGSQPWPFPDSLMIAFTASWASGEIRIDGREIIDAGWFRRDALPEVPGKASIARRLIDGFRVSAPGGSTSGS